MPTGYTAGVADGTVEEFKEYALQCARAFGACVMLRDEPLSSDIPEFEPSDYHINELVKAEQELLAFSNTGEAERREMHAAEHKKKVERAELGIAEKQEERGRYESMLEKARQFQAPSPEHIKYAEFLVSQLEESIAWDCNIDYYEALKKPVEFHQWESDVVESLTDSIEYHKTRHREEIERAESRNLWIKQLRAVLDREEADKDGQ